MFQVLNSANVVLGVVVTAIFIKLAIDAFNQDRPKNVKMIRVALIAVAIFGTIQSYTQFQREATRTVVLSCNDTGDNTLSCHPVGK